MTRERGTGAPDAALLAAVCLVPLVFTSVLLEKYALPKLVVGSLTVASAWAKCWTRRSNTSRMDPAVAALLGAAILSAAAASDPWRAWLGIDSLRSWGVLGWAICVAAFFAARRAGPRFIERAAFWICVGAVPVAIYALVQAGGLDPDRVNAHYFSKNEVLRPFSTLAGPVPFGGYLALVLPFAACVSWTQGRSRPLGWITLALAVPALFFCRTRSAWLGAFAGMAVLLLLTRKVDRRWWLGLAAAATVAAIGFIGVSRRRVRGDLERLETWHAAILAFRDHPFLGVGPDGFWTAYKFYRRPQALAFIDPIEAQADANDDVLQVAATLGFLGVCAYAWLHVEAWNEFRRRLRRGELAGARAAVAAGLFALFVFAKLDSITWPLMFLAAVLAGGFVSDETGGKAGRGGMLGGAAMRGASFGLFAICVWLSFADHFERMGQTVRAEGRPREGAMFLERAIGLNPGSTTYRINLDNLLLDVAESAPGVEAKRDILDRAWQVARDGTLRHPDDPEMWLLLGHVDVKRSEWAGEDRAAEAEEELEQVVRLAPTFARLCETDLERAKELRKVGSRSE